MNVGREGVGARGPCPLLLTILYSKTRDIAPGESAQRNRGKGKVLSHYCLVAWLPGCLALIYALFVSSAKFSHQVKKIDATHELFILIHNFIAYMTNTQLLLPYL